MKVLVTGVKGQLGYDVMAELAKRNIEAIGVDIDEMDITDKISVEKVIGEAARYRLFAQRCEWLVSKKEALNLSFVLHTGDVVNWGDADESQLVVASDAMAILDNADIPVVYALGNHDTAAVGVGGSAAVPSETITRVRDTAAFNKYFSTTRYPYLNVKDEGIVDNSYALLEAGVEGVGCP